MRRGVSRLSAADGCEIALCEEADDGTVYAVLDFARTEPPADGRYSLSWVVSIDSSAAVSPPVVSGSRTRIPQVIQRVQFAEPALPDTVWWFRDFDHQAGSIPPRSDQLLRANPAHLYTLELTNVEKEWWGIGWSWPEVSGRR
jgi:hypothetical protein